MRAVLFAIAFSLSLASCGGGVYAYRPAPEHDFGWGAGYREVRTGESTYELEYYGFEWQRGERLDSYFRQRAMELCGSPHYKVSSKTNPSGFDEMYLLNEGTMSVISPNRLLFGTVQCVSSQSPTTQSSQ